MLSRNSKLATLKGPRFKELPAGNKRPCAFATSSLKSKNMKSKFKTIINQPQTGKN